MFQPHHPYEKRIHIIYKLIFMTVKVINRCNMINEYTYWKILMSYRTASVIFSVTTYDARLPIFAVSFSLISSSNAEFKLHIPNFAFFAAFCDFSN